MSSAPDGRESSSWELLVGDCREVLSTLPAQSVHTVVTSPPYFGLRDYGAEGQIGLEPTPDEFVAAMVAVFREVRRVLRDDGTVWLNLGDSYASGGSGGASPASTLTGGGDRYREGSKAEAQHLNGFVRSAPEGYKPKDLLGIPWMVAFALRADGWYLRSDIIWAKPNPMPESVTDRPTKAHEYLFLLSKSPRYFYDADAIREPLGEWSQKALESDWGRQTEQSRTSDARNGLRSDGNGYSDALNPAGRNKRSVWTVATQPYAGAHFATFPPKLIEPCILAGAPERACGECGAPWVRVVERGELVPASTRTDRVQCVGDGETSCTRPGKATGFFTRERGAERFEPSCSHGDGSATGVVLDPFAGAGTTGVVALRNGRDFIGIELNPEYAGLARPRLERYWRDEPRPEEAPQLETLF